MCFQWDYNKGSNYVTFSRFNRQHNWADLYDKVSICTLIINKIFIWAPILIKRLQIKKRAWCIVDFLRVGADVADMNAEDAAKIGLPKQARLSNLDWSTFVLKTTDDWAKNASNGSQFRICLYKVETGSSCAASAASCDFHRVLDLISFFPLIVCSPNYVTPQNSTRSQPSQDFLHEKLTNTYACLHNPWLVPSTLFALRGLQTLQLSFPAAPFPLHANS